MSCNGCRVLRKGCSDSCALRPCLQWIEGAEAQGHATVFVAKFFGRAGLMGFISAVPDNQRPALFRSLLYEACGRTVNPVYGAVGLLWSGNWHVCQAAVDTVLRGGSLRPAGGAPITNLPCYGPMPNLPRLHMKSTQTPDCHHQEQDLKRFKSVDRSSLENNGLVSNVKPDSSKLPQQNGFRPLDQARDRTVAVKRERDEAPEIIAPVARRPRVGCRMDHLVAVDEAIDLDLTLSSHPPTPQLFLPRKNAGNSVTRVASPVSCSNSFSSEGSVTSLDTGDFIASKNIPGRNIPGMDLLQTMERR